MYSNSNDWDVVFKSWNKILSFFLVFIINVYILIPLYLRKKKYDKYFLWLFIIIPLIICFSLKFDNIITINKISGMPPMEIGPGMPPMELSENMPIPEGFKLPVHKEKQSANLLFIQHILIAFFVVGVGTAYKVILFWIEEEKQKKIIQQQIVADNSEINEYLFVKSELKMVKILISDILYVESANEYIKIYLDNGEVITTFMRLKNIESKLSENQFMRVQRSFIINLTKIHSVEKNRIVLNHMKSIPIGQQYKEKIQEYLGKNFIK